ncbi:hypothetical protein ACFL7M_12325 [Thermodesulfobacteriota bacterium]
MRFRLKILFAFSLGLFLITISNYSTKAEEEKVRAKIGIQIKSGDRILRAKSIDRLKRGDFLRIYVNPEKTSHVYVIHTDLKKVTLLNMDQQKTQNSTMVMPSLQEYYQVDGKSSKETITIIISPNELSELFRVFEDENMPYAKWIEHEKRLIDKSKIDLGQKIEKPFSIAGNVRGVAGNNDIDSFVNKLQIFSGKSILVKKYEFKVKR